MFSRCHIALNEVGLDYSTEAVDLETHEYRGGDFHRVNPKGYVPALELEDGQILTENAVILQYIADHKPETKMVPKAGSLERYRVEEWLSFIGTEIHKNFAPLFHLESTSHEKSQAKEVLGKRFEFAADSLKRSPFLTGSQCTVADIYFYVMMTWAEKNKLDLRAWPQLAQFTERMRARPAVQRAMKAESMH